MHHFFVGCFVFIIIIIIVNWTFSFEISKVLNEWNEMIKNDQSPNNQEIDRKANREKLDFFWKKFLILKIFKNQKILFLNQETSATGTAKKKTLISFSLLLTFFQWKKKLLITKNSIDWLIWLGKTKISVATNHHSSHHSSSRCQNNEMKKR